MIWNHLRRERAGGRTTSDEQSNLELGTTLDILHHPFQTSYNVTTFNQVLYAICHPLRTLCVRSLGLRNAVVIMDEFHKLPFTSLPYFFRMAAAHYARTGCRFIFGSATPMPSTDYLGTLHWRSLPQKIRSRLQEHPAVDHRRIYRRVSDMTIEDVGNWISTFEKESETSLLVVLNLVGKGTWPLRKRFVGQYAPERDVQLLENEEADRVTVFLDGLTPPFLRKHLIGACKRAMEKRPVTLITTQMVEVGVDLDFEHGLVDFQGLAATIQRGGRIGRNALPETPCTVEVFRLMLDDGKPSNQLLRDVRDKYDARFQLDTFTTEQKAEHRQERREDRFFKKWQIGQELRDSEITEELLRIQRTICEKMPSIDSMRKLFRDMEGSSGYQGLDYLNSQFIAEIYGESGGQEVLVLESRDAFEHLYKLLEEERQFPGQDTARELRRFVAERRVQTFIDEVFSLSTLEQVGTLPEFNGMRCFVPIGSNII